MAQVRNNSRTPDRPMHSRDEIKKTSPRELARDDISGAFSGRENASPDEIKPHSTHEGSRRKRQESQGDT